MRSYVYPLKKVPPKDPTKISRASGGQARGQNKENSNYGLPDITKKDNNQ